MDLNSEQILIVYSTTQTSSEDLLEVQEAVRTYVGGGTTVRRVVPLVFDIPSAAAPGATLGTELTRELHNSIGAVVFVDDLRPNIAYEMGFFHGQGRSVLLLTRSPVDSVWMSISDLAGAALADLSRTQMVAAVHGYLERLYDQLGVARPWGTISLPTPTTNLLGRLEGAQGHEGFRTQGDFGPALMIHSWGGGAFPAGFNLLPGATAKVAVRTTEMGGDFSIYFRVRFVDRDRIRRRIWLGLTSRRPVAGLAYNERSFPAQSPTKDWRLLVVELDDLLRRGSVLGSGPAEFLETFRVRAGVRGGKEIVPIEVGYFGLVGVDE